MPITRATWASIEQHCQTLPNIANNRLHVCSIYWEYAAYSTTHKVWDCPDYIRSGPVVGGWSPALPPWLLPTSHSPMSLASSAAGHRTVKHLLLLAVKWVIVGAKHLCFYSLVNTLAGLLTITTHNQDGQHMHVLVCIKKWHKSRIMNSFILFPHVFPWAMSMLGQFSVTIITVLAGGGRMQVPAGDWGDKSSSFSSSLGSSGLLAHQGDEYTSKLVPQID